MPILELIAVTWPCEYDLLLERYAKAVALSVVTVEGLFLPPFIQGSQMCECCHSYCHSYGFQLSVAHGLNL